MTTGEFRSFISVAIDRLRRDNIDKESGVVTYQGFLNATIQLKTIFRKAIGETPMEVEFACEAASAIIAPTTEQAKIHTKNAASLGAGASGIALVLYGIGTALGWGSGVIATAVAFFTSINLVPILGQIVTGAALVTVASYLYFHEDSPAAKEDKAFKSLSKGIIKYLDGDDFLQYKSKVDIFELQKDTDPINE